MLCVILYTLYVSKLWRLLIVRHYHSLQKEIASERAEEIQKLEHTIEEKEKAEIAAGIEKPQILFLYAAQLLLF